MLQKRGNAIVLFLVIFLLIFCLIQYVSGEEFGLNLPTVGDDTSFEVPTTNLQPVDSNVDLQPIAEENLNENKTSFEDSEVIFNAQAVPTVSNVLLSSTDSTLNDTNQNLSVTYDVTGTNVYNITSWYKNSDSIMIVNMPFEPDGNQNATDYSGVGSNSTVYTEGGSYPVYSATGGYDGRGAYTFDNKAAVNLPNGAVQYNYSGASAVTFSVWVNPKDFSATSGSNNVFTIYCVDNWAAALYSESTTSNYTTFGGRSQSGDAWKGTNTSTAFPLNQWTHFVGILDFANARELIYINGQLETNASASFGSTTYSPCVPHAGQDSIGSYGYGTYGFWNGSIDDFRVYNQSLTSDQVLAIYNNQSDFLHSSTLAANQQWKACVTSNDGTATGGDGAQVCSNTLTVLPTYTFNDPTPPNGTSTTNTSLQINVSINDNLDLSNFTFNWNGTDYAWFDDNLVLMMNMDNVTALGETTSLAVDVSNRGNNATLVGHAAFNNSGYYGVALEFLGDDSASLTASKSVSRKQSYLTFAAWINPYTTGTSQPFFVDNVNGVGHRLSCGIGTVAQTILCGGRAPNADAYAGSQTSTTIPLNTWTYVTATFDLTTNNVSIYFNGAMQPLASNGSFTNTAFDDSDPSTENIAVDAVGFNYFTGLIDELRIWNVTLTSDQVQQLYYSNLKEYSNDQWEYYVSEPSLADGTYTTSIYYLNTGGTIVQPNTLTFYIDTTLPDVLIDYPLNTSYSINVSELNYSASDNIAIDSCWYSLDEGTTNTTIVCGTNLTDLTSNEGDNTWYVWANDTVGNENSTNVSFFKDTIVPSLIVDLPANTSYNSLTVNLNYIVSDTNLDSCWYSINDGNTNTSIVGCLNTTFVVSEGENNITVYANDTLDNLNMSDMIFFNIDTILPEVLIDYPLNTSYGENVSELNYTVSDNTALDTCWYSLDEGTTNITVVCGTNLTDLTSNEGDNTWYVWANDTVGNENSTNVSFFKDTILPDVLIDYPVNTSYGENVSELNYTVSDNTALDTCWYSLDEGTTNTTVVCGTNLTDLTSNEGDNTWYVWANDTVGNENSTNISFFKDTIVPSLIVDLPVNTSYNSLTVNLDYIVLDTNLDSCWYSLDDGNTNISIVGCLNTTFVASEGENNLTVYTNDTLDNLNMSDMIFFNIDTISPLLLIDLPVNESNYSLATIELNYTTTDDFGVDSCWYSLDDGNTNISIADCLNTTFVASEGENNITVYTNDTLDNTNTSDMIFFNVDTISPSLLIDLPVNESNYSLAAIELNYTVIDSNLDSCWYSLDDGNTNTSIVDCLNITFVASEGANNLTVYANDTLDNLNMSDLVFFNVDTTLPDVLIDYPLNTSYAINVSELNYTASDNTAIDSCWYSLNEGTTNTTVACGTNLTDLTSNEGDNTWYVWANDTVGNENSTNISFFKDTTLPILLNASAETYSGIVGTEFIFNVTAIDDTTEIDNVNLSIQNPDESENTSITLSGNGSDYNGTWDTTSYSTGIYYIDLWFNDSLDNTIEKDNIFPIVLVPVGATGNIDVNQTVDIVADNTVAIDAQASCDVQLSLLDNQDVSNGSVSIACFDKSVENATTGFGSKDLSKYFTVVVSDDIENNLQVGTQIRLYYTDAEITAAGVDESTLRIYRFNETTSQWDKLNGGVNTVLNYVYADVTSFSSFGIGGSAPSTPGTTTSTTTTTSAGGGGGGAGGTGLGKIFDVDKGSFNVVLGLDKQRHESFDVVHKGDLSFGVSVRSDLGDHLQIQNEEFTLKPRDSQTVGLNFIAGNVVKEVTGKIFVNGEEQKAEIPVDLKIVNGLPLNIFLKLQKNIISTSGTLKLNIKLAPLQEGLTNLDLEYVIEDLNENKLYTEKETVDLTKQLEFDKQIKVPDTLKTGKYKLKLITSTNEDKVESVLNFEIEKNLLQGFSVGPVLSLNYKYYIFGYKYYIISALVLIVILFLIIWMIRRRKRTIIRKRFKKKKYFDEEFS